VERVRPEELIARLNRDGAALASHFGLQYRAIEAERPRVKRRYGVCYADGTIRIRLRHAATGKPLKYSSLVNTLCHELAHLQHFNHGLHFQRLYRRILEHARAIRIYLPGPDLVAGSPRSAAAVSRPPAQGREAPRHVARSPQLAPRSRPTPAAPVQLALFETDRRGSDQRLWES
jgi:hypothetical protein